MPPDARKQRRPSRSGKSSPASAEIYSPPVARVAIALNAVLAVVDDEEPKVLCVGAPDRATSLPYGPFEPGTHRTFEIGVREWVSRQANVALGYVEQLYTFGDKGREAPVADLADGAEGDRIVSVGYLALASQPAAVRASDAAWRGWYDFFPWEDWRNGPPAQIENRILPALAEWAEADGAGPRTSRLARIAAVFGTGEQVWKEERALERYELMYEAGLVAEAHRDASSKNTDPIEAAIPQPDAFLGASMRSDHRRILATAIGRLRSKLKYRPVIFELMPDEFTLFELQRTAEAIVGFRFHKQNFRRSVEKSGLVIRTDRLSQNVSGRPAALFRTNPATASASSATGLIIPRMKSGGRPS